MSSPILQHPDEAELMRFLDGELAEREAQALRRHTGSCWQCRRDLNEMQTAIDAYLRLRDAVAHPPPHAWDPLRLPVPEKEPRRVWPVWRMALAVAVVIAGVFYPRPSAPVVEVKKPGPVVAKAPEADVKRVPEKDAEVSLGLTEVQALAALHRVGADLGEAVEVIADKDGVRVRATALDAARAAVIRAAVAGARFELVEPKPVAADGAAPTPVVPRPVVFGAGDELANAVIDESDAITSRAHALGRIAARFQGVTLSPADAVVVRDIKADHGKALRQHAGQLRKLLAAFRVPEAAAGEPRPLAESARELDELVSAGFAGAQSELSDAGILGRLQAVLRELER